MEGVVYSEPGKVAYKIEGKWNQTVSIIDCKTSKTEEVFKKEPYPEKCDFMYGFTHFSL